MHLVLRQVIARSMAGAWVVAAGWSLPPSLSIAQPSVTVSPPHEIVQGGMPEQAKEITAEQDWPLVDADPFRGKLLQWSDPSGLVFFRDQFGRPATFPLRQLEEPGRKTIDKLLRPHLDLMSRLRDREPLQRPQGMSLGEGQDLQNAEPIDVTGDSVYWRVGQTIVRSPMAHFPAGQIAELRKSLEQDQAVPLWHCRLPRYDFRAELVGQTRFGGDRTAYVFRGFQFGGHYFTNMEFLVNKQQLAAADQERGEQLLASKPNQARLDRDQAPQAWWPLGLAIEPPKRPLGLEGGTLKIQQPLLIPSDPQQRNVEGEINWGEAQMPAWALNSDGELLVRQLLEEERLKGEQKDLSGENLAKELRKFTDKTIAEKPLYFLSPLQHWPVRDFNPNQPFLGRLVAERGLYWIFFHTQAEATFAVLKSEIPEEYQAYGAATIEQLTRYFQEHPELSRPELETKFRVVRLIPHSVLVYEPIALRDGETFELKPIGAEAGQHALAASKQIHFLDARELKLVLSGEVTAPAEPGSVAGTAGRRDQLLAAGQLREEEQKERSWTLSMWASGQSTGTPFGFSGALQGRHQDDYVFRQGKIEFLVDPDLLDDKARIEAEQLLGRLAEMRQRAGVEPRELARPELRLWGYSVAKSILGSKLHFTDKGWLVFLDPNNQENQMPPAAISPGLRCEVAVQERLEKSFRATAKPLLSAEELKRVSDLKQEIRAAETQRLAAEAAAKALDDWHLKDCAQVLVARFVRFDGDDVIMKLDTGELVRVLKVAFTDESREKLEEVAVDPEHRKRAGALADVDPATVTLRLFRSTQNSHLPPGKPVNFDPGSMIVELAGGGHFTLELAKVHPRDVSEMRSQLYLKVNGVKRDDQIDERLKRPIDPKEVLQGTVALNQKWRGRLDEMLQPRELVWRQRKLDTLPGERVLAISPDGSHVILGPGEARLPAGAPATDAVAAKTKRELRVVEISSGRARPVPVSTASGALVFLTGDNRQLVICQEGSLELIDLESGKSVFQVDDLKEPPLAACQSAEGNHLVLLLSGARILFVSTKDKKSELVRLQDGSKFAQPAAVWCSSDGARFVVSLENKAQVFAVDLATNGIKPDFALAVAAGVDRPMVALAKSIMVMGDPKQTKAAVVAEIDGRGRSLVDFTTGLKPAWIGIEHVGKEPMLHVIGRPSGKQWEGAEYSFSACIGLDRRMQYTAQSIDGPLTADSLFAPCGRAVALAKDGQWYVATRCKLSNSPLFQLDDITQDMVDENSLDQIDAAWAYLRTEPFQKLGEYPDQAAERFFDLMSRDISLYGWQHGGDLEARAELLLARWEQLAPRSLFVPTLKAMRERDRAWKARGTGFADTVTEQGAKEFRERMLAVAALLKPLFKEKHPPTRAFNLAFDVAMSLSLPMDVTKNLNKVMMQTPVKYSTPAHSAVVLLLLPRWHGDPGDSEYYITKIADALGGDVGDCMYAQLVLYAARYHPKDQPLSVHINYDAERLLKGLKVFYRKPQWDDLLQSTLTIFAAENYWDLYKQTLQLQVDARVFCDAIDSQLLERRQAEASKALAED